MKKLFYLFVILPMLFFAQGENDNWYFGDHAGVNFSGANPTVLNDSQLDLIFGCATLSDNNGNLLFYTDGKTVMNRENVIMDNGANIANATSFMQEVIVKFPTNPQKYFIISCEGVAFPPYNPLSYPVSYSIVDMSQGSIGNNGLPLGKVLENYKNITIPDQFGSAFASNGVTVVPHSDGVSYWVLIPHETKLYSYLINSNGFNNTPIISNLNISIPNLGAPYNENCKASTKLNNGIFSHYINLNIWNGNGVCESQVLSFDNLTGHITNNYNLVISSLTPTTGDFNKNSNILYIGRNGDANIYAINLASSTTSVIYNQIYTNPNANPILECTEIQRNRNDDIYINFRGREYLSKVINPDIYGGSSVALNNLFLNGKFTRYSLPQLVRGVNYDACYSNLTLTSIETYGYHTYQVSDNIITKDNYTITPDNHIIMKAGNNISLLPNTYIQYGGSYLATIEDCISSTAKQPNKGRNQQKISLALNLDKDLLKEGKISIYPNPTSDFLTIKSDKKIISTDVFDISGRKIDSTLKDNKVDVRNLQSGIYIIEFETEKGEIQTQKFIKK